MQSVARGERRRKKKRNNVGRKIIRGRVANRLGFRVGDIIVEINDVEVNSVTKLKELVSYNADRWKVLIKRGNEILSLVLPK